MNNRPRLLDLDLPKAQSAFLWGARKTGKSTLLKEKFPDSIYYDLLKTDTYFDLLKRPSLLREQLLAKSQEELNKPVIIDEMQKIPQLLDEVHWLIENKKIQFILCGSSARKLKRGHANLLGGRAWSFELYPFVSKELKEFSLIRALNQGLIPSHYFEEEKYINRMFKSYVEDYLKQEIFAEGLTRNIPAFSRFFEVIGFCNSELINYSNIARDCGIDAKTVKEYFQILIDTLVGVYVEPYTKKIKRDLISKMPKFYLFDVGIAGYLENRNIKEAKGEKFGKAFEHFLLMELLAYRSYKNKNFTIKYWRTKTGLEVDFILGMGKVAIEVKGSARVDGKELKGLKAFREEHSAEKLIIVSNEKEARVVDGIMLYPWFIFLDKLWNNEII